MNRHYFEVFGFSLSLSVFKDQLYSIERNVFFFFYKTNKSFVFHIYIKKDAKYTYLYDTLGISKWPINILILRTPYYQCLLEFNTLLGLNPTLKVRSLDTPIKQLIPV